MPNAAHLLFGGAKVMENGPDETFAAYLAEGRFMLQRSPSGAYVFYPRIAEPRTGAPLEWVEASGLGIVHATTVTRKRSPSDNYNVAIIELAEGPRMMSSVGGIPPEDVHIGMKVRARIDTANDVAAIFFEPAA